MIDDVVGAVDVLSRTMNSSRTLRGYKLLHGFTAEDTLELVNDELNLLGIQRIDRISILPSSKSIAQVENDEDNVEEGVDQLLHTLFQLVELQRRNVNVINDLEMEKKTSRSDRDRLFRQMQQMQQQQSALKHAMAGAKEKERRAEVKIQELTKMLNAEREEKKKLFQAMQYKEKQFVHENRKNEREMSRLREHLQQLDKGETCLVPPRIEIINDLKRPGGRRRSTWTNLSSSLTKEEEALYSVVVANFGERQKQLLAENATLRQSLASLKLRVGEVVGENHGDGEVDDPSLRLPIHLINLNQVEEQLSRVELTTNDSIAKSQEQRKSNLHIVEPERSDVDETFKEEKDRLLAKMEYYEETIERQAKMIERLAMGNAAASASSAAASAASSFSTSFSSSFSCTCRPSEATNLFLPASEKSDLESPSSDGLGSRAERSFSPVPPLERQAAVIDKSVRSARTLRISSSGESVLATLPPPPPPPRPSQSDGLLANYLVEASLPPIAPSMTSASTTGEAPAASSKVPAASSAKLLGAYGVGSSGRSSMTSITSLSRINSTLDAGDEAGAFV